MTKFLLNVSILSIVLFASVGTHAAHQATHPSVFFISPKNGAVVSKKFKVKFGLKGMKIHPAGEVIEGTGHHHLLINQAGVEKGVVVAKDETHIHFGKGDTETELNLSPGKYRLTLQFADGAHVSYGPEMSQTIEITVK